jgi:hypothetical protein
VTTFGFTFLAMKILVLLLGLVLGSAFAGYAVPRVQVQLSVEPTTHVFTCRYTFALPAGDTTTVLRLNLRKTFRVQRVQGGRAIVQARRLYYPYFADTMQQVVARYPAGRQARTLTLDYTGTLDKERTTAAQVLEFSGHTNWLPFRPLQEYEVVEYALGVHVPAGYQVRSTSPPLGAKPGYFRFEGRACAIELTAIIAPQFWQAAASRGPAIAVVKAGAALSPMEAAILPKAQDIVAFYNRTIGRQDSIARFTVLLTGTKQDAFAVLENATVITYADNFDVAQREDLLVLAHEISHKWWGYGSVHDETDWLNEAFATYSSMLYLQARGDTASYRQNYEKLAKTTPNTPPIIGFDRTKYESGMYRRVVYNKGMVVLAALHTRVGTEQLYTILARTAAQQVSTTTAFLGVVGQVAGAETRTWLQARLSE